MVLPAFVSQLLHLLLLLLLLWVHRVLLCDFGCARHWETKQVPEKRLARFGTFAGTPAYMSPQVCGRVCVVCFRNRVKGGEGTHGCVDRVLGG